MPLRLRTPDFDLLLTLDTFAAGFLLLGSTGVRNDADTRIERLAISLQLIAFSLYVGAIFTAIVGSPSCFFPIAQLMSGQGVLVTFAAVFVAAYARLEEDGKTEFAWSIFIGCVCVFCMPGYILTLNLLRSGGARNKSSSKGENRISQENDEEDRSTESAQRTLRTLK